MYNVDKNKKVIEYCDEEKENNQVPPRFELGSLDSESRVLTITPWNRYTILAYNS